MRLNFLVNRVFDGWEPTDTRLGGTERGVVEWAEELAGRGHTVHVYRNGRQGDSVFHGGVYYDPRELYLGGSDVCINVKSPEMASSGPTIFYTNDVDADKQDLSKYGAVIHISEWAKENIPVNNPNVFVVPHGYDPDKIYPERKVSQRVLYASSPDRGLVELLRVWPEVGRFHPGAQLMVTYGADFDMMPRVNFLGEVGEEQMDELYRTSEIWCHPASGGELQCITGMKAQAAGCWPVYYPTMALSETVKFGTKSSPQTLKADLIKALSGDFELPDPLPHQTTVAESTDKLLEVVEYILGKQK
jgi:glycosyltransferase involved in cell wall biosynthesis